LRVIQVLCMATAFALTLSYLAEQCSAAETAGAFAAYITGNVASNLVGRLMAAAAVDHLGIAGNFYLFAALNLAGALLVYFGLAHTPPAPLPGRFAWSEHWRNARLRVAFAIGFLILFAFIGTFTYVNFVLVSQPLALGMMALGLVYLVFAPSIVTTPLAGRAVARYGTRATLWGALALAIAGLPLLLAPALGAVLPGLALVGVGTFLAQATTTGLVGRAATGDRGSASGVYLACYFLGGLAGAAVLGALYDAYGWGACVAGIGAALAAAAALAATLPTTEANHERTAPIYGSAR
jgi:MFS transporter, YNFM family, putative membrane transport protein